MATNDKRRQKKLERRNAKRKQRQHEIAKTRSRGLAERLTAAASAPILDSLITEGFHEDGMGQALLSRQLPSGEVAFAMFLIDRYCLGVKDAFGGIHSPVEYREMLEFLGEEHKLQKMPPADLRCLIEEAIEYARDLGLEPHADYRRVRPILGDLDPGAATERFDFGCDGKPLFRAGPDDDPQFCRRVINILEERCGSGGFDYMLAMSGGEVAEIGDGRGAPRFARLGASGEVEWDDDQDDV